MVEGGGFPKFMSLKRKKLLFSSSFSLKHKKLPLHFKRIFLLVRDLAEKINIAFSKNTIVLYFKRELREICCIRDCKVQMGRGWGRKIFSFFFFSKKFVAHWTVERKLSSPSD